MANGLQPYASYKDSGVPWLGKVPEHWTIRSLGSLTTAISDRGRADLPLLSVLREKGVVLRSDLRDDENRNFIPDDLSNYKVAREGDLVINKMKAWAYDAISWREPQGTLPSLHLVLLFPRTSILEWQRFKPSKIY